MGKAKKKKALNVNRNNTGDMKAYRDRCRKDPVFFWREYGYTIVSDSPTIDIPKSDYSIRDVPKALLESNGDDS
jgi:hypothetical protein